MSEENFKLFEDYDKSMVREALSKALRTKHLQTIITLSKLVGKNWIDVQREDVDELVYKIMNTYSNEKGQESHSSYDMKKILRIFFRWYKTGDRLREEGKLDPYELQGIKLKTVKDKLAREDLIVHDDLELLLKACGENLRDRAIIDVHHEAGTRPGETLSVRIKDVKIDDYGAKIHVIGKTTARPIRLIRSVPNLLAWMQVHPHKNEPNYPLWTMIDPDDYGEPLTYYGFYRMLKRRVADAKLSKRIFPNLFRHSAATEAATYLTEQQLKKKQGWSKNSKQPARYVHLVDSDVDDAILKRHGIKKESETPKNTPIKCQICNMFNPIDAEICSKCTKPLDLETAMKLEEKHIDDNKRLEEKVEKLTETLSNLENFKEEMRQEFFDEIKNLKIQSKN